MENDFILEEFLEKAKRLGIDVELNSDNPGIFTEINGEEIEVDPRDLFPKFWEPKFYHFERIVLPEVVAKVTSNFQMYKDNYNNTFKESKNLIGAA
ncbi:hypothetical protein BSNK01_28470 [Bacillaceae bacterium]